VHTLDEGRYLCAVLNSRVLAEAVVGLQARGQHNPRDFDMHVFTLPFPTFDSTNDVHRRLADLAQKAEDVASALDLDDQWQFQKARRVTREALREDGVSLDIDAAVAELLTDAATDAGTPDLLGIIADALEHARIPPSGGVPTPAKRAPRRPLDTKGRYASANRVESPGRRTRRSSA
jgi:hypothetical protein